jgi:hypothetical protein
LNEIDSLSRAALVKAAAREHSDMLEYNTTLCDFLSLPDDPRQTYSDVVTQVYPLRADVGRLQTFCDEYLNLNGYQTFKPLGPWVIMQVLNYGKLSWKEKRFAHRWFAQHELAFGIPVGCFDTRGLQEFAMVFPFIFVDNPLSMEGGRQLYGWSKAGIQIDCTLPQFEPNDPRCLLSITFTPNGLQDLRKTSLQVSQKRPFLSGRSGVAAAMDAVPRAIGGYLLGASGLLDTMGRLVSGYQFPSRGSLSNNLFAMVGDLQSLAQVLQQWFGYMNALVPTFYGMVVGRADSSTPTGGPETTIFTMKQVRDAQVPADACYRAIVRSKMKVEDVKDGGLLFDLLSGDPTGGIEITLSSNHGYIQRLIDLLSLRKSAAVSSQPVPGSSQPASDISLQPLMPFWAKLDLSYGLADYQCWRSKYSDWQQQPANLYTPRPVTSAPPTSAPATSAPATSAPATSAPVTSVPAASMPFTSPPVPLTQLLYIKRGSGAGLEISGRRNAPKAVLHCLKFTSDKDVLQELVNGYLNLSPEGRFKFTVKNVRGVAYIYVTLLSYDEMTVGPGGHKYSDQVLTFAVMADYESHAAEGQSSRGPVPAVLPLYTFVGSDWNFITEYEVNGKLTFKSTFISPEDAWIKESAFDQTQHRVLTLRTTLFPGESEGESATDVPVIEIDSGSTAETYAPGSQKCDEYLSGYGLSEYLTPWKPGGAAAPQHPHIALKQVRNATLGKGADYQALIGVDRVFAYSGNIKVLSTKVIIHNYPGFPIVSKLGLEKTGRALALPDKPFEFDAEAFSVVGELHEEQGKELWWRVAPSQEWTRG